MSNDLHACLAVGCNSQNCSQLKTNAQKFQRQMSWFKQRGRAQRSAISIVNCRTPGIDRHLNAACASGTSLGADLNQCRFSSCKLLLTCRDALCFLRISKPLLSADLLNFHMNSRGAIVNGQAFCKVPLSSSSVDSATSHKQDMGSSQQTR